MPQIALQLPSSVSPSSLRLGSLVYNTDDIYQENHDPFEDRPAAEEVIVTEHANFHDSGESAKGSNLRFFLSDVFSISRHKRKQGTSTLDAQRLVTRKLLNSNNWFRDACGTPKTRSWLERAMNDRRDVYLLVGVFLLTDATYKRTSTSGSTNKQMSNVPVLPTALSIMDTVINIVGGASYAKNLSYGHIRHFDATGEQTFGLWYRKVKFKWSLRRQISPSCLSEKTRWKPLWEWRSVGDDGEETDEEDEEILEASLEGGGDWEEEDYIAGGGEHLLQRAFEETPVKDSDVRDVARGEGAFPAETLGDIPIEKKRAVKPIPIDKGSPHEISAITSTEQSVGIHMAVNKQYFVGRTSDETTTDVLDAEDTTCDGRDPAGMAIEPASLEVPSAIHTSISCESHLGRSLDMDKVNSTGESMSFPVEASVASSPRGSRAPNATGSGDHLERSAGVTARQELGKVALDTFNPGKVSVAQKSTPAKDSSAKSGHMETLWGKGKVLDFSLMVVFLLMCAWLFIYS